MKRWLLVTFEIVILAAGVDAGESGNIGILDVGYPRALFFRRAEGLAASGRYTFDEWDACFSRLNGVIGKCLDEEVLGRSKNVPFFRQFKENHPDQTFILHINGNVRDTTFNIDRYSPGHWLYFEGCGLAKDLADGPGRSVVHVENPGMFRTGLMRRQGVNDDVGICRLGPDGKPDWNVSEQVKLISVDRGNNTITIERGAFGTDPMSFEAGETYVAPHACVPPPFEGGNLRWAYNYSTTCPRDQDGRNCADVFLAEFAEWFGPGGICELADGATFDVSFHVARISRNNARLVDVDADGKADGGFVDGVNVYGLGVRNFYRGLGEMFGDKRLIMADGQDSLNQRAFGILNGMESEGFPVHRDTEILDWSGALNRLMYWQANSSGPRFNYVVHKFRQGSRRYMPPYNITRLVLATAVSTDSAITMGIQPPHDDDEPHGIWDELWAGKDEDINWMGRPLGPARRLAADSPDLLRGEGIAISSEFVSRWSSPDAVVSVGEDGKSIAVKGKRPGQSLMHVQWKGMKVTEHDVTVFCDVRAGSLPGNPADVSRLVTVSCELVDKDAENRVSPFNNTPLMTHAGKRPFRSGFSFRDVGPGRFNLAVEIEGGEPIRFSRFTVHNAPDTIAREFERGAIIANPSLHPYQFNLDQLFPGAKLTRLRGTADQDPATNNGMSVSGSLNIPAKDALFLRKAG